MRHQYKVWIEISRSALRQNIQKIRSRLNPQTQLWAVVKSNAYGHGLISFSCLAAELGVNGFCVDSVIEGCKLRDQNIKKPILVLGVTLPQQYPLAQKNNLLLTVSHQYFLKKLSKNYPHLPFHLKVDTGMHRQGFTLAELPEIINFIKTKKLNLSGLYSHLAAPQQKDFSEKQLTLFNQARQIVPKNINEKNNFLTHLAATGGVFRGKRYHFDLVRVGMGLYGCRPGFCQALSWHSFISEIKKIPPDGCVGYDLTETVRKETTMAVVPIGYWHGYDRRFSGVGEVIVKRKKARVLGRVSMDMIVIDISHIPCQIGEPVTILGSVAEMAKKINASPYEIITRINPLIKKIIV